VSCVFAALSCSSFPSGFSEDSDEEFSEDSDEEFSYYCDDDEMSRTLSAGAPASSSS